MRSCMEEDEENASFVCGRSEAKEELSDSLDLGPIGEEQGINLVVREGMWPSSPAAAQVRAEAILGVQAQDDKAGMDDMSDCSRAIGSATKTLLHTTCGRAPVGRWQEKRDSTARLSAMGFNEPCEGAAGDLAWTRELPEQGPEPNTQRGDIAEPRDKVATIV